MSQQSSASNSNALTATNQNGHLSFIHDIYESLQVKFGSQKKTGDILPKYEDVVNRNDITTPPAYDTLPAPVPAAKNFKCNPIDKKNRVKICKCYLSRFESI